MMGIASCPNLTFRVHPFCKHRGGGLVQDTREDREALQDCKVKNNIATKSDKSKPRNSKKKPDSEPGRLGEKASKSKSKKRRRRKESRRRKAKLKSRRRRKRRRRKKKKGKQVS